MDLVEHAAADLHWFMIKFEMACIVDLTEQARLFAAVHSCDQLELVRLDYTLKRGDMNFSNIQRLIAYRLERLPAIDHLIERDRLVTYAQEKLDPLIAYVESHFLNADSPLYEVYRIYKEARLCNPG